MPKQTKETVLAAPARVDGQWQEKITEATQAREMGRQTREGKPKTFRRAVGRATK